MEWIIQPSENYAPEFADSFDEAAEAAQAYATEIGSTVYVAINPDRNNDVLDPVAAFVPQEQN